MEDMLYRPPCPADKRSLAMVYGEEQRLRQIWEPAQAIRNGTLYPELYKPMNDEGTPIDCPNPSASQTLSFSAWELRLYLNTHPNDKKALELYKRYCAALNGTGYACAFTPDGNDENAEGCEHGERWRWIDDPWPWELGACREGNCNVCV